MLFNKKNSQETEVEVKEAPVAEVAKAPQKPAFEANRKTVIGKGVTFVGDFSTADPIQLNGQIEGNIVSDNLVEISVDGAYHGDAQVNSFILHGKANGNIRVEDLSELTQTADMVGRLTTGRLKTEDGSSFEGDMKIKKNHSKPAAYAAAHVAEEAPAAPAQEPAPAEEAAEAEELAKEEDLVAQLKAYVADSPKPAMQEGDIEVDEEFLFGKH